MVKLEAPLHLTASNLHWHIRAQQGQEAVGQHVECAAT